MRIALPSPTLTPLKEKTMDVKKLPKIELHRHLELSFRQETLKELAPSFGIDVSTRNAYRDAFLITEPMTDLNAVLKKFLNIQKVLQSEEVLERLAFEACEDTYTKENIKLLELRYSPTFIRGDKNSKLEFEAIHQAICRGITKAKQKYNIAIGLLGLIQRILPVKEAHYVMDFIIENKKDFVGVDLADNEDGFEPRPFSPVFQRAKKEGLGITIHAGEINTEKSPYYVKDAVEHLGAERIGHGIQIYKDPEILQWIVKKGIVLEVCPTSNVLTNAVTSMKEHPIRTLLEAKVQVMINTDDPCAFDLDLNHEYQALVNSHNFTMEEFERMNQTAFEASFLKDKPLDWKSL